ncbi:MAG TPA: siderophore-interacting protein [Mycobacteriales bacterium]|nr:siderophore-interacting protein [Mycobacteriales bacterium]
MADRPAKRKRTVHRLQVLRTEEITPHMIRVYVGGPGMHTYSDNPHADRYVKVVFRRPEVDYPEPFDMDVVNETFPREQWPVLRTYTVRTYDPVAQEIGIDFVYHGEEGFAGPFAAGAKPGDDVFLLGPGGAYTPDPQADWHLLIGDEAVLPAIGNALERIPAGKPVHVYVLIENEAEQQALQCAGDLRVTWLHREDAAQPELADAVRELSFPEGAVHAFVHGEAAEVREVRALLRERGVTREQLSISGYWRRGVDQDEMKAIKHAEAKAGESAPV